MMVLFDRTKDGAQNLSLLTYARTPMITNLYSRYIMPRGGPPVTLSLWLNNIKANNLNLYNLSDQNLFIWLNINENKDIC